ncbi:MerR family transcriptional regulator [Bdellovibrio sp. HCB2-146]|uniref:MerR family transcriptional regulator n=1 Tax=Bdellovibrio sp. HCB2-146 TaxID=3394362 RepID=UPI0039BCBCAD
MLIGELSQKTGLSRDTLRFYEKEGLIRGSVQDNGYRRYSELILEQIQLIHLAKTLGFSLKEIKSIKAAMESKQLTQANVRKMLEDKLEWIERQMKDLKTMKKLIQSKLDHCDNPICD